MTLPGELLADPQYRADIEEWVRTASTPESREAAAAALAQLNAASSPDPLPLGGSGLDGAVGVHGDAPTPVTPTGAPSASAPTAQPQSNEPPAATEGSSELDD